MSPTLPPTVDPRDLDVARRELASLAYIATHDLQEPLRQIAVCADGLLGSGKDLDPECRGFADLIVDATRRMRRLVTAVHRYASITVDANFVQPTDLRDLLHAGRARVAAGGGTLEFRGDLPLVDVDPDQMEQVFEELAKNATQFAHPERALRVLVHGELRGDEAIVRFIDNGRGVPPGGATDVFRPFCSAHPDRTGLGVGLTLVRRIIEEHNGSVVVSSGSEGFEVCFRLPLASASFW